MSLKQELEQRLMQDMILKAKGNHKAIALIVSPHTSKILSSCARMYDVMEAGVIVIENIMLSRQRLNLPAVYFVEPTPLIVDRLLQDFKDPSRLQYTGGVHLYFTSELPADQFTRLKSDPNLLKHMRACVELYCDFMALEGSVFTCDRDAPLTLTRLFPPTNTANTDISQIAQQLVSLCLTIHEYPYVRYMGSSDISKKLSSEFERQMNEQMRKLKDWNYSDKRERGTLMIVDRSIDPVAPLMHEFTFQAMINDCLTTVGELCFLSKKTEQKENGTESNNSEEKAAEGIVLGEDDPLWVEYRHRHISHVMKTLTTEFKLFREKNAMVKLQQESAEKAQDSGKAVKELGTAVKDLAMYKEMMKKYEKHMSLAQACHAMYEQRHLRDVGFLEQDIATGMDEDGHKIEDKKIRESLLTISADQSVLGLERVRLVMLYLAAWGALSQNVKDELLRGSSPSVEGCINGISKVGVNITRPPPSKLAVSKERSAELVKRNESTELLLMRYLPIVQSLMEATVNYTLNEDDYPFVTPPPEEQRTAMANNKQGRSARRKGPQDWKKDEKTAERDEEKKPRTIVFIIGGMTFSEMRAAYEVSDLTKSNVYVGSTSTLTVKEYVQGLGSMGRMEWVRVMCESNAGEEWEEEYARLQQEERKRREAEYEEKKKAETPATTAAVSVGAISSAKPKSTGCAFCWAWVKGEEDSGCGL